MKMGLLFLAFPVLEIWSWFFVGGRIGFANTMFAFIAAGVLGFGLIRTQGAFLLTNFQASLAKGELPAERILSAIVVFVAGALFIVPGFFSDLIALILVVPGTRHLAVGAVRKSLKKKMQNGSFRMASFGNFGGFGAGFKSGPNSTQPGDFQNAFRDVTPKEIRKSADIIDIKPIKRSDSDPDN